MEKTNSKPITVARIVMTADYDGFSIEGEVDKAFCRLVGDVFEPEDPKAFHKKIKEATETYIASLKRATSALPIVDENTPWSDKNDGEAELASGDIQA